MSRSPMIAFVIASSLPVTFWPLAGLGIAAARSNASFDFSIAAITVPLLFGAFHAVSCFLGLPGTRKAYFVVGALLGLVMASIGTFVAHVPETVYGCLAVSSTSRYLVVRFFIVLCGASCSGLSRNLWWKDWLGNETRHRKQLNLR